MSLTMLFMALVIAAILAGKAAVKVPEGYEFVLERLGRYHRILPAGFHWIRPWVDGVARRMSKLEQVLDIPVQQVITLDNAVVMISAVLFFKIHEVQKAAYEVPNLETGLFELTGDCLRKVAGELRLDDLLRERNLHYRVASALDYQTRRWGIKVLRVEIKDVIPQS